MTSLFGNVHWNLIDSKPFRMTFHQYFLLIDIVFVNKNRLNNPIRFLDIIAEIHTDKQAIQKVP